MPEKVDANENTCTSETNGTDLAVHDPKFEAKRKFLG